MKHVKTSWLTSSSLWTQAFTKSLQPLRHRRNGYTMISKQTYQKSMDFSWFWQLSPYYHHTIIICYHHTIIILSSCYHHTIIICYHHTFHCLVLFLCWNKFFSDTILNNNTGKIAHFRTFHHQRQPYTCHFGVVIIFNQFRFRVNLTRPQYLLKAPWYVFRITNEKRRVVAVSIPPRTAISASLQLHGPANTNSAVISQRQSGPYLLRQH